MSKVGAFYKALQVSFKASGLAAKVNGLWVGLAKPETPRPYIIIAADFGEADRGVDGEVWQRRTIQFSIFTDGPSVAVIEDLYGDLTALLENASFTVTGARVFGLQLQSDRLVRLPDEENGWQFILDYSFYLE